MIKTSDIEKLAVWQKSMQLAEDIYHFTTKLPMSERFGLADQMRRAAVSIPSNIAEGHGRYSSKDFIRFLSIARGSLNELKTQTMLCQRLYSNETGNISWLIDSIVEIDKMINALAKSIGDIPPRQ